MERLASAEPRIPRRSERHDRLQHYATPPAIAWAMALAGGFRNRPLRVMDPSAGTGTLLGAAGLASGSAELLANEVDRSRARLLTFMAPEIGVTTDDALRYGEAGSPESGLADIVLMNPPFSARVGSTGRHRNEDLRHLAAARRLLAPKGRLVALLAGGTKPGHNRCANAVAEGLRLRWQANLDGRLMRSRKMNVGTRLCVFEPAPENGEFDPATDAVTHTSIDTLIASARNWERNRAEAR